VILCLKLQNFFSLAPCPPATQSSAVMLLFSLNTVTSSLNINIYVVTCVASVNVWLEKICWTFPPTIALGVKKETLDIYSSFVNPWDDQSVYLSWVNKFSNPMTDKNLHVKITICEWDAWIDLCMRADNCRVCQSRGSYLCLLFTIVTAS